MNDPLFKDWVASACVEFESEGHCRPEPIMNYFLHVGNQSVHHTHRLSIYKGFVYCGRCGYRKGTNQVRKLAKPCAPPGLAGVKTLSAIQDGKLPPGLTAWPDHDGDDGSSSEGSQVLV